MRLNSSAEIELVCVVTTSQYDFSGQQALRFGDEAFDRLGSNVVLPTPSEHARKARNPFVVVEQSRD